MTDRDLIYETNNIGFDEQYPNGGIKCKNFIDQLTKEFVKNKNNTKTKLKMIGNGNNTTEKFYIIVDKS